MPDIVGVRFKSACKVYYFSPEGIEFNVGDNVIVETIRGIEFGFVAIANKEVADDEIKGQLKPIIRKATEKDLAHQQDNLAKRERAMQLAQEKIDKHKLGMNLTGCEYTFDDAKIILYYTADGRVDFRELVKDLASVFHIRVELRQIGKRDECKQVGGLGPCGRPCCCATHLTDFDDKVSIHMAKTQGLSLNPGKISGLCGLLMCCLRFENDHYEETSRFMPAINSIITTPQGKARVVSVDLLRRKVKAEITSGDQSEYHDYDLEEIKASKVIAEAIDDSVEPDLKNIID
ncbi:MAG: stage 0 sporulation family protein [Clostridia bacterium]